MYMQCAYILYIIYNIYIYIYLQMYNIHIYTHAHTIILQCVSPVYPSYPSIAFGVVELPQVRCRTLTSVC